MMKPYKSFCTLLLIAGICMSISVITFAEAPDFASPGGMQTVTGKQSASVDIPVQGYIIPDVTTTKATSPPDTTKAPLTTAKPDSTQGSTTKADPTKPNTTRADDTNTTLNNGNGGNGNYGNNNNPKTGLQSKAPLYLAVLLMAAVGLALLGKFGRRKAIRQ